MDIVVQSELDNYEQTFTYDSLWLAEYNQIDR